LNGVQTSLTYDGMLHVSTSTGPEGVVAFTYDTLSRPTSRVLPDGSSARIEYSFSPAMTKEIVRNRWTKSYLDGLGRVVKTERGHGGVQLPPGQTMKPEVTESVRERPSMRRVRAVRSGSRGGRRGCISRVLRLRGAPRATTNWGV
jgi:YD repeat-containing protein